MRTLWVAAVATAMMAGAPAAAQDWRPVAPENLLVIDTAKGRILAELDPRAAPRAVERIRTLADQGFYDGLKFHRVIPDFMAQTGDPEGTGAGGSELPDIPGEFEFRRGRGDPFVRIGDPAASGLQRGLLGSMAVTTQPDAQMMVTADFKASAMALFCPGVLGMARNGDPDSANSQFFIMTGRNDNLDGAYTPFGRVLAGLDAVRALKSGSEAEDGRVVDPDVMTRVRTAAALPEADRPTVRVQTPANAAFLAEVERVRTAAGPRFDICDVQPAVEVAD
ncbi:peptidylprolyl isomerase [Brevundimonas sp.]|uniref:peptidylprolyl isomerase n=1 Tax=Brevundimonas sp. TaxID=1871086 RepID=UPI0035B0D634